MHRAPNAANTLERDKVQKKIRVLTPAGTSVILIILSLASLPTVQMGKTGITPTIQLLSKDLIITTWIQKMLAS